MEEPQLTSPGVVRDVLAQLGIRPLKRLGQNFLIDRRLRDRIVLGLALEDGDRVVEIGPGLGAITQGLAAARCDVRAIEIDRALAGHLRTFFGDRVTVLEEDALAADLPIF